MNCSLSPFCSVLTLSILEPHNTHLWPPVSPVRWSSGLLLGIRHWTPVLHQVFHAWRNPIELQSLSSFRALPTDQRLLWQTYMHTPLPSICLSETPWSGHWSDKVSKWTCRMATPYGQDCRTQHSGNPEVLEDPPASASKNPTICLLTEETESWSRLEMAMAICGIWWPSLQSDQ